MFLDPPEHYMSSFSVIGATGSHASGSQTHEHGVGSQGRRTVPPPPRSLTHASGSQGQINFRSGTGSQFSEPASFVRVPDNSMAVVNASSLERAPSTAGGTWCEKGK